MNDSNMPIAEVVAQAMLNIIAAMLGEARATTLLTNDAVKRANKLADQIEADRGLTDVTPPTKVDGAT